MKKLTNAATKAAKPSKPQPVPYQAAPSAANWYLYY
jgi:hypothetical protein